MPCCLGIGVIVATFDKPHDGVRVRACVWVAEWVVEMAAGILLPLVNGVWVAGWLLMVEQLKYPERRRFGCIAPSAL